MCRAAPAALAALALGVVAARGAAQPPPDDADQKTVRIQRAAERPVIDGDLNEEIWVRAPLVDDFHQVTDDEVRELLAAPTV